MIDEHVGEGGLPIGRSAVQAIFSALAGGMITFTGIVFSAVFVAAQIQTSSYSPRLAARLRRDPVIIAGLALPTATASYSLVALATLGHETTGRADFVPVATVVFGLLLALVTLGAFVALVQRAFESTQIGGILRTLMRRGYAVIDDVHPRDGAVGDVAAAPAADPGATEVAHSGPPAVIAAIDRAALLRLAEQTGGFVEVVPMVGEYLGPGRVVLRVGHGRAAPDPALARRVFVLARQRTIDQDPAFALRMLVDIAIRALSPAVNDPTTAVQSLDRIEALLVELAPRHPGPSFVVDAGGTPRALVPAPRWADYVELGLVEIRRYGARLAADRAPAHRALRPPRRGGRRGRAAPDRARAAAAARGRRARVPRRRGARDRRAGATGSGSAARASAARDRRQDRHLVGLADRGVEPVEEADVLAPEVHVDEAAQAAVGVGDPLAQLAVLGVERLEHLADRARRRPGPRRRRRPRRAAGWGA